MLLYFRQGFACLRRALRKSVLSYARTKASAYFSPTEREMHRKPGTQKTGEKPLINAVGELNAER